MGTRVRPLTVDDLEALGPLDSEYADRHGLESSLTLASANFHARSGHSFVLVRDGRPAGFVLAQAVWNGVRPTVRASRLVSVESDQAGRVAMTETLTKSAYDAAVYDIEVEVPGTDEALQESLGVQQYGPAPSVLYRRTLGSRGAAET